MLYGLKENSMTLTSIGEKNIHAFAPLMQGISPEDVRFSIGAVEDDRAVGVCMFDVLDEALVLDYIYVLKEYRRKGIGSAMLKGFIEEIKAAEPTAIHINFPDVSKDLMGFFTAMDFKLMPEGKAYRIKAEDILDTEVFNRVTSQKINHRIERLFDITEKEKKSIWDSFEKAELDADIIDNRTLSKDLSLVAFDKDEDTPEALVLCEEDESSVSILFIVNFRHDTKALLDIIHALKDAVLVKKGTDCDLVFVTMDEKMEEFAKTLVGEEDEFKSVGYIMSGVLML